MTNFERKCVYCENSHSFNKEHVIPQFMGSFFPINPTIKASDELICKNCNSVVFSGLENVFKEDSQEGIHGQMLNLTGSNSVRIRGKNVQMECLSPLGDKFFNEIFPFLKEQNEKLVVEVKPQIKVKNYAGETGYQIFLFDALKEIKSKPRQFEKVKQRLKKVKKHDIAIFVGGNDAKDDNQLAEAINLLDDYSVKYNEKSRKFSPIDKSKEIGFEVSMQCTITDEICRFISKVAFNYFSYCALQGCQREVLYNSSFDLIKKFILGDKNIDKKNVVVEVSDEPILWDEKQNKKRYIGHIIIFYQEDNRIYSRLTFFAGKIYKVLIGQMPMNFTDNNFGCGHLFYPFDKSIHNLTQQPKDNPSEKELRTSFELFKRI